MKPRILIVEDEPGIADTLQYALRTDGFEPAWCATGEEALARIAAEPPALVILDVGLPDASGFEIFRRLRETSDVPVVFLTARSDEIDRVVGLELGADDYVAKPFSPRELVARVRAVSRRGRPIALTRKEFELLAILAGEPGRVFGRDELLDLVWGRDGFVEPRTVDVHLARLRGKFLGAKLPPPDVETVRGVGYRFREPA